MTEPNHEREGFFRDLFLERNVRRILDCACGTGKDLVMFHNMGFDVQGSDLSPAMLTIAEHNLLEASAKVPIFQASFCELPNNLIGQFNAVVCLTNSINEILDDTEVVKALRSMRTVLQDGGIIVLDQGQTDFSMVEPPRFATVVNNQSLTRFFVMDYSDEVMTVNIFDFVHTEHETCDYSSTVKLKIRLRDQWSKLLQQAGFTTIQFFGDWKANAYNKNESRRLIMVAS